MASNAAPYIVALSIAAAISMILALVTLLTNRAAPGSRWAAWLMVGVCIWSLSAAIQFASSHPDDQLLWGRVLYLGVTIVPATWFGFALVYGGHDGFFRRVRPGWLAAEPLLILALIWTNDLHHLFRSDTGMVARAGVMISPGSLGPAFWVHTVYSYVLLAVGTFMIIRVLLQPSHLYRAQASALLVGALVPWLANMMYVTQLSPWPDLDATPLALTVTGLVFSWAMLRVRLWRLSPIARAVVVEGMSDGVFVFDGQDHLVDLNPAAARILGRPVAEVIGQGADRVFADHAGLIRSLSGNHEAQWEIITGQNEQRGWYDMRVSSLHDRSNRGGGQIVVLRNISELKRTEEQLSASEEALRLHKAHLEEIVANRTAELQRTNAQLQAEVAERREAERQLRASLNEKEVLLQEVHHRVKNNLQVVSSLLNLQAGTVSDPGALDILQESQHRVRAMALIHEKLYRSRNLAEIDFGDYIRDLVATLLRTQSYGQGGVQCQINAESLLLPLGVAMPCGLILNELVSNALKHAFPHGRRGEIRVTLGHTQDGQVELVVADDGIGLPDGMDWQSCPSLGLQLVSALVDQLEGTLAVHSQGGAHFVVTFPLPAPDDDVISGGQGG